jgi:uncharacterized tellurite resistance protein B-like protein
MPAMGRIPVDPVLISASIGQVTPAGLADAAARRDQLPPALRGQLGDPLGASAVILALLLDDEPAVRDRQWQAIASHQPPAIARATHQALESIPQLPESARLDLACLALPALRAMSEPQFQAFAAAVRDLVQADQRVSLFEFALHRVVIRALARHHGHEAAPAGAIASTAALAPAAGVVLSALAQLGAGDDDAAASAAYTAARTTLNWPELPTTPAARGSVSLKALDQALDTLADARPRLKKPLVEACARCVAADGTVTPREAELLRAVVEALGLPMPPLHPPA